MEKILFKEKGIVSINYLSKDYGIENFIRDGYSSTYINISFIPTSTYMTEEDSLRYTDSIFNEVYNEVQKLFLENESFYHNFQIEAPNRFTGFTLGRSVNENKYYVIKSLCSFNCKLIKNAFQM